MIPTQWCQLGTPPGASSASILVTAWLQKVQGRKLMSAGYNLLCPTPCMHQAVLRYPSFRRFRDVSALVSWLQVHYISKRLLTLDLGISPHDAVHHHSRLCVSRRALIGHSMGPTFISVSDWHATWAGSTMETSRSISIEKTGRLRLWEV
jgi:hypothetical protein